MHPITRSRARSSIPDASDNKYLKIASWNICGLRSMLNKSGLSDLISLESPDIICLNETMLQYEHIPSIRPQIPLYYHQYFACSVIRKGYSGVSIFTKSAPISVTPQGILKHDNEGRTLIAEYPSFYLVSTYVPNVGAGLKRMDYRIDDWENDIRDTLKSLQEKKPVIWCGDFNVVHEDIDIYNIKGKESYGCCTPEERGSFRKTLKETKMLDSFRVLHPGVREWSYYSRRNVGARDKGQGWRLDYILISAELHGNLCESYIRADIQGSDHHPVLAVFKGISE